jgi:hypothetical protein
VGVTDLRHSRVRAAPVSKRQGAGTSVIPLLTGGQGWHVNGVRAGRVSRKSVGTALGSGSMAPSATHTRWETLNAVSDAAQRIGRENRASA